MYGQVAKEILPSGRAMWAERRHRAEQMDKIKQLNTDDPNALGAEINKLGPGTCTDKDIGVQLGDNTTSYDPKVILSKWRVNFKGLFTRDNGGNNEQFTEHIARLTHMWGTDLKLLEGHIEQIDFLSWISLFSKHKLYNWTVSVSVMKRCVNDTRSIDK